MFRSSGFRRLSRLWLNLSFTAKGAVIVAIPAICSVAMLFLLADAQERFESANQWVIHTEQVLSQSRELLAASLSVEASARGYLLTREPAFLDIHQGARRRVSNGFSQVLQLTEDNPGQQEHMRRAMGLVRDEIAALDRQIEGSTPELRAAVNDSRVRLDTLKAELDGFDAEEHRLLAARRDALVRHRDRLRRGVLSFCFVGGMAAVFGVVLFTSNARRRLERIAGNAARLARRESDGPVDLSPDAIGRLEATLVETTRTMLDREQKLSENALELERAKSAAEAAVKAKTEFVANISHEIRSPMNALLGAAEMLSTTELDPKQAEFVKMIDRAGNSLLSVINEVLDHAKLEAGRLELEQIPFDLEVTIGRVKDLFSATAAEKGLELVARREPGVPRRVIGDGQRLQRVLINLVSNALKFTEKGSIAITVAPGEATGMLRISVADTGIGIPRDRQEAIFGQFTQADASTTRQYGGTGLGLSIARHIVELMDGRIRVESEPGAGSTFIFTAFLPEAPVAESPVKAAPGAPRPVAWKKKLGARILLAEDSATSVSLIHAYLSETGCALEVASDGEAALGHLTEGRYNLVLMDAQMPKLDGYEVMRRFRAWERSQRRARTPIVAVTAHAFQEDIENAIKAGADAQLTKPFRRDSLLEAIELYQRPDGAEDILVDAPEFLRELAIEFLRRQRYGLMAVSAAYQAGDFDPIQSFAHNMKGCGKSFGFPRLIDLGREMERAAKDQDAAGLSRQIAELREYLTGVDVA